MAIGSGPLQQRASLEEGLSDDPQDREYLRVMGNVTAETFPAFKSRVGTYLPGVTGPHPTCGDELINLPAVHGLVLFCGSERLDLEKCQIDSFQRRLDLSTGRLSRTFVWHTQRGSELAIRFERFISAHRPHIMALRCSIHHRGGPPAEIRCLGTLDADIRTNGFDHFISAAFTGQHPPITAEVRTNGGDIVAAAALLTCEAGLVWSIETAPRWAAISGTCVLDPGHELVICKYAALTSSRHIPGSPLDAARNQLWSATAAGFDRLAAESDAVWRKRWNQSDVVIEGDPPSQLALRASIYHLMRAVSENDARIAIDPKAAAGEAYCGRYFWDTEMFILPMFLYTRPQVARNLATYRVSSLDGARRNARRYGYPGARFGWEASPAGDDHCPNGQYADHEIHVTADVAYGLWHAHLANPGDGELLRGLTEVLTESARYWCERVWYNPQRDEYELIMVMGPDEYAPFARNNAYTNHLVGLALELTRRAWVELRDADPGAADRLQARLSLTEAELAHFGEVSGKLRFPYDTDRRLVLQSDDFFEQEPFDFARWRTDRSQPLAAQTSQERLYRSQVLKQADVVQLMVLFPHQFDLDQMRVAYQTYEPLTSHDSSLSRSIHAILAAWIGDTDAALRFWDQSAGLDLCPGAAAEGVHAACAGGNWQVAIFGFAGVRTRMQSDVLQVEPNLPARWRALRFPFVWRGQLLQVNIEPDRVTIEHRGERSFEARVCGRTAELAPGQVREFPR